MNVKFVNLGRQYQNLKDDILAVVDRISSKGDYVMGQELSQFEDSFSTYCQTKYAIGVGTGSDALFLSLKAMGIGPGDEVLTAPNSFIASAWTIAATGATPKFVDISTDLNINPLLIEQAITPKTKAIMPVHFTGKIANMTAIQKIAKDHQLLIIEDSAQAIGAQYRNQFAGSFGECGCFSLHPLKNLHVHGDGGIITTNSDTLFNHIKLLRNHGLKDRNNCTVWGYNSRLDSIQAGIANIKLNHLDGWTQTYRKIAAEYTHALKNYVQTPAEEPYEAPVYHRYMIRVQSRDALQHYLTEKGIETKINYPIPIHLQEIGQKMGHTKGDFPETEKAATEILSLPIYPELESAELEYVIEHVILGIQHTQTS